MIKAICCTCCKRLYDFSLEEYDKVIAHCEAYPNGIPEAVVYAGHFYPKPNDNGFLFVPTERGKKVEKLSKEEEDSIYNELKQHYEELDMSNEEWLSMKRKQFEEDLKKDKEGSIEYIIDEVLLEQSDEDILESKPRRETEPKIW